MVPPERYGESAEKMRGQATAARDGMKLRQAHLAFWYVRRDHGRARSLAITKLSRRYNQPFEKLVDKYGAVGSAEALRRFVAASVHELAFVPVAGPDELLYQAEVLARDVRPLLGWKGRASRPHTHTDSNSESAF